ncbi:MAG TPA: DinB family protein [Mycobacteriales bacterium]|nr:DinB family protein [Mycobacteriales bacterium]
MNDAELKSYFHHYLQRGRDAVVWKLEDLSEYDVRRPLVATGTNLLGLVKHLTFGEGWYFGACFDRPFPEPLEDWAEDDSEPNSDMYARADESREFVIERFQRACAHADATIEALPLDAVGFVPWWPSERAHATLGRLLIHVATETHRHAGHADLVRELIDGAAGVSPVNSNLPEVDADFWPSYRERLEQIAQSFRAESPS